MGLLSAYLGSWWRGNASEKQDGHFCGREFPQMWESFVDNVMDSAYTRQSPAPPANDKVEELPTRVSAAQRLVAIGDLHGDLTKAKRAFQLAGLTDDHDNWVGGKTVCVQVGDILDRGDQELKILYYLERLQQQADKEGGKLYVLNGNHETMNIGGNFRYATAGADVEMNMWHRWQQLGNHLREQCNCTPAAPRSQPDASTDSAPQPPGQHKQYNPTRHEALKPGGPITTRFFARHPTVLQVGSTVFVHGGVLPSHVEYGLDKINKETQAWMLGHTNEVPPGFLRGATAIVWARDYSARQEVHCDCETLQSVLDNIPGAKRMVVGHTIQDRGITSACDNKVFRIDVGMSQGCGNGHVEVLEIREDNQVLRLREGQDVVQMSPEAITTAASAAAVAAAAASAGGAAQGASTPAGNPQQAAAGHAASSQQQQPQQPQPAQQEVPGILRSGFWSLQRHMHANAAAEGHATSSSSRTTPTPTPG
eukprot:jgi/Chrzof1/9603/Cz04g09110.t1